jgi:hypothetical protein
MASFRNITPFTHDYHFLLTRHEFSTKIINLSLL